MMKTFTPIIKMMTVRTMLAISSSQSWLIYQMDVKNAFLYGDLDEIIYMRPTQGLLGLKSTNVCKV